MDEVDAELEPRADEHEALMKKHMPELVNQETEAETYNTWQIQTHPHVPLRQQR
jgi:ubiquitin carboxyl-terminal hydrolase 7